MGHTVAMGKIVKIMCQMYNVLFILQTIHFSGDVYRPVIASVHVHTLDTQSWSGRTPIDSLIT